MSETEVILEPFEKPEYCAERQSKIEPIVRRLVNIARSSVVDTFDKV